MANKVVVVLATLALASTASVAFAEKIGCTFKNGTAVSVEFKGSSVTYSHFDKTGKLDMQLPVSGYATYAGANGGYTYYRFTNGHYVYAYKEYLGGGASPGSWNGIVVNKNGKFVSKNQCASGYIGSDLEAQKPPAGLANDAETGKEISEG